MSTTENNKRMAKNTAFLYMRMLLIMAVTLYTSRVVLAELGVVDFGVYNVVAGVVAMLGFLKASMSLSVQRFLSYEMGRGKKDILNIVFNTSLFVHILLAIIVVILAETIGLWFVQTQLIIPQERLEAALFVYHCVVVSTVFSIIEIPYNAMLLSSEKFNIYAYVSIIEAVLKLLIAYLLIMDLFDKLKLYGFLTMVVTILIMAIYMIYVICKYPETKIRKIWDTAIIKNILSFSWWSLLGELAWVFVHQGINILINIFNGPVVNAARAISYQVNGAVANLTKSFQQAVNPQLIKQYASNNIEGMTSLLFRSTRYSYYLMLFITFPLLIETPYILDIWLGEVPQHTVLFCRLVLIGGLLDGLSNLLATVAKAYGKIKNYQMVVSFVLMMNFPLSYVLLKMGYFPEITMYIYMFISVILLFVRLHFAKCMIGMSIINYMKEALWPILKVTISSTAILLLLSSHIEASFGRFIYSCFVSFIVIGIITYIIGLEKSEKGYLLGMIKVRIKKRKR